MLPELFLVALGLNVIWEFAHCFLYETCRQQTWRQNIPLLLTMSLKDAALIVLFYLIAGGSAALFLVLALGFAFIDEKVSLRLKRWEYAAAMPTLGGVGLTPLLEIAVTGLLSVWLVAGNTP